MDIFGVGIAEIIVIVFVILVVGGPRNAAKWARETGRMIRQVRLMINQMMSELEKDLGEDGRELMNVTRELTRNVNEMRSATDPRRLARQASRLMDEVDDTLKAPIKEAETAIKDSLAPLEETTSEKYAAWTPKNNKE